MRYLLFIVITLLTIIPVHAQERTWVYLSNINTDTYHEFSPTVSPDGSFLIFHSTRPNGMGDTDLYISYNKNGTWSTPVNMQFLNSPYHDQQPFLTYDGRALYFSSDRDGTLGVGDIYVSYYDGERWTAPKNCGAGINSTASEWSPSISLDGKTMYFVRVPIDWSTRRVDSSQMHICRAHLENNTWGNVEILDAPVNIGARDTAPRIMPDGKTLFFASARDGGYGSWDLWRVTTHDNGKTWSGLTNLGAHINSAASEAFFSFNTGGNLLFLTRQSIDRPSYDIWYYGFSNTISDPTVTVTGIVTNTQNGKPLESRITIEELGAQELYSTKSAKKTGKYSIVLPKGKKYGITVEKDGFMFNDEHLNLVHLTNSAAVIKNIGLQPLTSGESVIINNIFFDPDKATLRTTSKKSLNRIVAILKNNPSIHLYIKGHTAKAPGSIDPIKLSTDRADSVKQYLVKHGISENRLKTVGVGNAEPIADNATEAGRKKNRRTEFIILSN